MPRNSILKSNCRFYDFQLMSWRSGFLSETVGSLLLSVKGSIGNVYLHILHTFIALSTLNFFFAETKLFFN